MVVLLCIVYALGMTTLYLQFDLPLIFISFVLILNLFFLVCFGNYMLRAVLFPYANYFIKRKIDSTINKRFSLEMAKLLGQMNTVVRIFAKLENIDAFYTKKGTHITKNA